MQGQVPAKVTLKRFYRPEDISIDTAYRANLYEVYASDETQFVEVDSFVGRCSVGVEAGEPGEFSVTLQSQPEYASTQRQHSASIHSLSSTKHGCNVCGGKHLVTLSAKVRDSKVSETRPHALTSNRICLSRQCIQSHCAFAQVRTDLFAPSSLIARAKSFLIYPQSAIKHPQSLLSPKARYDIFVTVNVFWEYAEHA